MRFLLAVLFFSVSSSAQVRIPGPGGSSSAVTPDQISGLQLWWAANFGSNCGGACSDGNNQTTWADKSSNGNNGSNATIGGTGCNPGVYHTNQINSKPAVTFTGAPVTCFKFGSAINLTTASTVFTVLKLSSTAAAQTIMTGIAGSLSTRYVVSGKEQAADNVFVANFGAGTASADTSWHQVNMTYNNTTATYRIDRAADGSATPSSIILTNELGIGFNAGGGIEAYSGQLAEFLIYNRVLNSTEIGQVETYLNGVYGL